MIPDFSLPEWRSISCCSVIMGGSGVIVVVQSKLLVWHQCRIYQLLMQFITTHLSLLSSSLFCYSSFLFVCLFRQAVKKFIAMQHTCMLVPVPYKNCIHVLNDFTKGMQLSATPFTVALPSDSIILCHYTSLISDHTNLVSKKIHSLFIPINSKHFINHCTLCTHETVW